MNNLYLEVISLVERLHRQFLEVVKLELDGFGIHDINNVQAMMLFNIGDAEMTVGELTLRGCYLDRTSPTMSRKWSRTGIWRTSDRCTTGVRFTFD
jgi:hypothetical protein